jgi:hypothetical protein
MNATDKHLQSVEKSGDERSWSSNPRAFATRNEPADQPKVYPALGEVVQEILAHFQRRNRELSKR